MSVSISDTSIGQLPLKHPESANALTSWAPLKRAIFLKAVGAWQASLLHKVLNTIHILAQCLLFGATIYIHKIVFEKRDLCEK